MLVDDKLAKEKLAREIEANIDWMPVLREKLGRLIRNTDLTDCQPQGKWCNYCRKDNHNDSECWSTRPANWKPEGLVNVFGNPIAPAPDQGSVRNATELAKLFHDTYERLAPQFGYVTAEATRTWNPESPNGRLMIAVCAAIRALPDQKD